MNRRKSDCSVYGVATDGLKYVFITITHEGTLLFSKQFDIVKDDLPIVLGCFQYILEKAIFMSPNLSDSPKSGLLQNETLNDEADEALDPDDSPYIYDSDDSDEVFY